MSTRPSPGQEKPEGQTPHDRVLTKAAGFDHHFVKPIDIEQLAKVLKQVGWIERRKTPRFL